MKTLLIFTSILVLAAGCASNKNKNAGAPPAPVTTETVNMSGSSTTGYTTAPQPGQTPVHGWYTIQVPNQ